MKTNQESIDNLKKWFPQGSQVFCVLRSRSRSNMSREIGFIAMIDAPNGVIFHPNYAIGQVLGLRVNKNGDGLIVKGCGMDMGLHVVSNLAHKLYGNERALSAQWLQPNPHH